MGACRLGGRSCGGLIPVDAQAEYTQAVGCGRVNKNDYTQPQSASAMDLGKAQGRRIHGAAG